MGGVACSGALWGVGVGGASLCSCLFHCLLWVVGVGAFVGLAGMEASTLSGSRSTPVGRGASLLVVGLVWFACGGLACCLCWPGWVGVGGVVGCL